MKASYQTLFFALLFLFSATGFASDREPYQSEMTKKWVAEQDAENKTEDDSNDSLEKILEMPEVLAKKTDCENAGYAKDLDRCIWEGVKDSSGNYIVEPLNDSVKEKVQKKLAIGENEDESGQYQAIELDNIKHKKSNIQNKLEKYFTKRLKNFLYEGKEDGKVSVVSDHSVFLNIQKAEITKSIINSISSFCMDASYELGPVTDKDGNVSEAYKIKSFPEEDDLAKDGAGVVIKNKDGSDKLQLEQNREDNIKLLATGKSEAMGSIWNGCASQIPTFCESGTTSSQSYKSRRACEVVTYLKGKRQELKANDMVAEGWKNLKNRSQGLQGIAIENIKSKRKIEVDNIVNVTSNEATGNDEYKAALNEEKGILETCKNDYASNKEACDKYLISEEDSNKLAGEYGVRIRGMESKVKKATQSDESLKKFLREEGYSEEKINSMAADATTIDKVKEKIKKRYANEREAMIKKMREKLKKRTVSEADKSDPTKMKAKFSTLEKELKDDATHYKQLLHFSNVVSGYLKVGSGENEGKNTIALKRELDDSAIGNAGGRNTASTGGADDTYGRDYLDNLRNNNKVESDPNQTVNSDGSSSTNIEIDTLNEQILDYGKD